MFDKIALLHATYFGQYNCIKYIASHTPRTTTVDFQTLKITLLGRGRSDTCTIAENTHFFETEVLKYKRPVDNNCTVDYDRSLLFIISKVENDRIKTEPLFLTNKLQLCPLKYRIYDYCLHSHSVSMENVYQWLCQCNNHSHKNEHCPLINPEIFCHKCKHPNSLVIPYQS